MNKRLYSLLALLLAGSVSLWAEDGDPFGEVNTAKYPNTMTITGYVRLGGEVLGNETVVAVYQGGELRGKKTPVDNGKYTSILMLTVYGETKGQPLHFKVFTEGRVIEVDQGLTFKSDDRVGKAREPYYIDLPVPIVTIPTVEGWATTCLPFNAEVPEGVVVWNATGIQGGELVLEKAEGGILPANTPVLLQSDGLTSYEWLSRVAEGDVKADGTIFSGTVEDTETEADKVLTLGHSIPDGEVGFWLFSGTTIPANRAYIADFPANSRGFALPGQHVTALSDPLLSPLNPRNCYDLLGRRVQQGDNGRPLRVYKKGYQSTIIIR